MQEQLKILAAEHNITGIINKRESKGNLRSLTTGDTLVDFLSNDYLGLARSRELWQLIRQNYDQLAPKTNGATGSRLLSGNSIYCEQLESYLAATFKSEGVLLFNAGYTANQAVLSSIPQRGDSIIYDAKSHACIKEGARLSFARYYAFKHNDTGDLRQKLERSKGNVFVVVESIYSMDGDQAPIREIAKICREYEANLIVDEAHSTGVLGENGSGLVCNLDLQNDTFLRIYTFGKGMGVHGACVAGSQVVKDYLVNFARPFIYTTALPSHSLVSIRSAFEYLKQNLALQQNLQKVVAYFNRKTREIVFPDPCSYFISNDSAIKALVIPGHRRVKQVSGTIRAAGFEVRPILSPTVKEGEERIRICLHAYNTRDEIDELLYTISKNIA